MALKRRQNGVHQRKNGVDGVQIASKWSESALKWRLCSTNLHAIAVKQLESVSRLASWTLQLDRKAILKRLEGQTSSSHREPELPEPF